LSKVVGARIDDWLYKKLKAVDRPNTVVIREALAEYLFKYDEKIDCWPKKAQSNKFPPRSKYGPGRI
jgi:hypothetical protein